MNVNHIAAFGVIVQALSERLRDPMDPRQPGAAELKAQVSDLCGYLADGQVDEARWQLMRLESFISDWDVVAAKLPEYIAELRRRIARDDVRSGYVGARSELAVAAFLLSKGLSVERGPQEGADFVIVRPEGTVLVESTSLHLSAEREENFYEFESAIRQKRTEPYCGPAAVLHVDYTAVLRRGGDTLQVSFGERLQKLVAATSWGAVMASAFFVSSQGNRYHRGFLRFDGPEQTPAVVDFLDVVLPPGAVWPGLVSIPPTA